jgi:hypothetical protein
VVALDAQGNPSFSALQAALKAGDTPRLAYFAFDLLNLSGEDLKPSPTSSARNGSKPCSPKRPHRSMWRSISSAPAKSC